MAAISFNRLVPRDRRERRAALACAALCAAYAAILGGLALAGGRFDRDFLARREALRDRIARTHPIPWGATIALGSDRTSPRGIVLGPGWSVREPNGIWTDGATATLTIWLAPPDAGPAVLRLAGAVQPGPDGRQGIAVDAGGREVARTRVDGRALDLAIALPASTPMRPLRLTLRIADPTRAGIDPRRLGFKLGEISLARPGPASGPR